MNIKEFSKKIGVPVSTISKALGDYKDVNAKTKKRIIELAKKHNYAPNIYAKTLASGITFSVGLVLPLSYSYEQKITLIDFIENIHSNLNSLNIPVIMLFAKNKKEEIEAFEKLIKHHKVRLVLLNDTKRKDERIDYLDKNNVQYITWGRCNKNEKKYSWIDEDIEHSNLLALKFILSKGHSDIGYIDSYAKNNYYFLRKHYFLKILQSNNVKINKKYFANGYIENRLKTKEIIKKLLLDNPKLTVLLISSHAFAMSAVEACRELNLSIGKNISIISFDSNILSSLAPFLTVVRQPHKEINRHFINLIQSKINNLDKNFNYLYKSKLVDNGSVIEI